MGTACPGRRPGIFQVVAETGVCCEGGVLTLRPPQLWAEVSVEDQAGAPQLAPSWLHSSAGENSSWWPWKRGVRACK